MTAETRRRYLAGLLDAETDLVQHIADIIAQGLPVDRQRFAHVVEHLNTARRLLGLKVASPSGRGAPTPIERGANPGAQEQSR